MSDDESRSKFILDLDSEEFVKGAEHAKKAIEGIGEGGLGGLAESMAAVLPELAALGVAFVALKKAADAVFDGEKIRQINAQFQALSQSAGLFAENLKEGLREASGGWADDTTLMQAANKALTKLESGAEQLPELMEAARKATAVMGGDFIQNFESMSQAVASGNTRQLRHLGIIIDQQKAYRDYAVSIGESVDTLSLAGRQQAVMNALLEQSKQKFANQNTDLIQNISLWNQIKATLTATFEVITLFLERVLGPYLRVVFKGLKDELDSLKTSMQASFGEGTEKVEALKVKITGLEAELKKAEAAKAGATDYSSAVLAQERIDFLKKSLSGYQDELKKTQATDKQYLADQQQHASQEKAMSAQATQAHVVDVNAKAKKDAEYAKTRSDLDKQILNEQIKTMQTIDQANDLYKKKREQEQREMDAKIAEVEAKKRQGLISTKAADDQIAQLNKLKDLKMQQDDAELARMQRQSLDNYQRHATNVFDGIGRSFHNHAQKAKMDLLDWGKQGDIVFSALTTHATEGFEAIGAGSQKAGDAMKAAMMNALADIAESQGQMMLIAGIGSLNPAEAAAGAALLVLAGFLRSKAGAAGGSSSGGGGGGYSGAGGGGAPLSGSGGSASEPSQAASNSIQKTGGSVHLVVQGSVFDSDSTRTRIADLVRGAQDSTDFNVSSIGKAPV